MIFFRAFSAIAASILLLSCTTSAISVDTLEINSTVLNQRIEFLVLKPTDYQKGIANGKRYPVLYLLHCAGCNHQLWLEEGYCPGLLDAVDSANFIVAIPYDGNGYGWWLNSPVVPSSQLETFIVNEFKPHIDSLYRTYTDRFNTGLAGHSMGGFGTLHLLSKYPSTFGVGYAMKPGTNIIKWENNWGLSEILGPQSTHLSNWKAFDLNMNATRFVNVGAKFKFTTGSRDSYFFKENQCEA